MDYDDKDFQSQNFQLVGEDIREDSSKFPSALRSFNLPSFDLDDHLQIHLRFDSLVEPGNLLGITGQEENNWIESFSTGGGTVGFSSNAAAPHSTSRNNNVWSEATSSESVEMLLKSVGEDGVMEIKTVSEQPDGNNTLNNLVSTTTNITKIVPIDTEMEGQGNADTSLAEKSHNHSPETCEDIVNVPSTDDQTFIGEKPLLSESSSDLVGCQSNDAHTNDMVICLSATAVEQTHQEEPSIDQKSLERAPEENSLDCPHLSCNASDDSPINNLGKTRPDAAITDVVATDDSSSLKSTDNASAEHDKVLPHEISSMLPSCQTLENQSLHSAVQINKCSAVGSSTNASVNPSSSEQQKLEDSSRLLVEGCNELIHSKESDGSLEISDKAKLGSSAGVPGTETRDEPFGDVNCLKIDSEKSIKKDNVDFEFSTAAEVGKADSVDCHKESPLSVQVVDVAMRDESPVMSGKEDEMQAFEPMANENPSDQVSSAKELMLKNPDILQSADIINQPVCATETDKLVLPASSLTEERSLGVCHEDSAVAESCDMNLSSSKTIITKKNQSVGPCSVNVVSGGSLITGMTEDCMDQVKDPSTATAHVETPKMDTIQKDPGKTDSNPNSTRLVPSGESEHTNQLLSGESDESALDDQLVSSGLPSSKLILSDKSSQSFSGGCTPVLERCETGTVPAGASNSESDVVSTSGQLTSTKTASSFKMHNSISANVAVKPKNEVPTDKPDTLEYAIDEKGHPAVATEVEKAEIDNLASSSSAGGAHCRKDDSVNFEIDESMSVETGNANISEPSCGSPNNIGLVQHSHDAKDAHGNKKGSVDHLQATEDHCVSHIEKTSCITESIGGNVKEKNSLPEEKGFAFEVGHLPERPEEIIAKGWRPFSSQSSEVPQCPQMTSPKSGYDQRISTEHSDISQVNQLASHDLGTKSADVEKTHPPAISSSKRWKTKEKSVSKKVVEKRGSTSNTCASSFGPINRHLQSEGAKKHSFEGTSTTSSSFPLTVASNLPDLNSTTTTVPIKQPFTDSQQVQLRAQIFVYGALIQGIPPDEACMVSAFGNVDGRSKWEGVWRAVAEKYDNQKSPLADSDTVSRLAVKVPSHMPWGSSPQSKVVSNPTPRTGNKGPATTILSPVSLPSPIWSMSSHDNLQSNASKTSHMEHSPVLSTQHSHPSPHVRQYSSDGTHFLPQSPCPVPWVASTNTSTLDTSSRSPSLPISNAVQFTPHRDLSMTHSSSIHFQSPASSFPTTGNLSSLTEVPVVSGRKKHATSDQKSRRRKRDSEPQTEVEPATGASKFSSTHADISSITSSGSLASTIAPVISPTHFHAMGSDLTKPEISFSEETCSKIKQAKLQAEDAAFFAAASVRQCEGIWKQLAIQRSSRVVSDVEEKLASAAVAMAAAVSVAKAASAAAKLAANSAMQAKLMADEAILSGKTSTALQICESSDQYSLGNMSAVTPASILQCKEKCNGSIIPAAREAARRRLEAASAATKRAENLDAILKAAELAAEAVSQAGALVAMGEPLPHFSAILEGGLEGYQRAQHLKGENIVTIDGTEREKQSTSDQIPLNEQDVPETAGGEIVPSSVDLPRRFENHTGIASPTILDQEDGKDQATAGPSGNVIQEGSLVEVMSDVKVPGGMWYSARVLKLEHSKAYICYNELLNVEGSDVIKEWLPLDFENDRAPRVRVSHPIAAKKYEGPMKRPRAVIATHSWDIGDRVDAWINEGWREGVIAEKCEGELKKFIVHFPAGGDTSTATVGSWDLRPSLVWTEGQWIQWSRSTNKLEHHEGRDTPVQKRRKITRAEAKINSEAEAPGKCIRQEDNTNRIKRTGLQKEGSKVVFGIPKPGKKRKFMDVSNHCVVENTEKTSAPVKFSKDLFQQASKVDARSKRSVDLKPGNSKPVKPRSGHTRSLTNKGNSSIPILSSSDGKGNGRGAWTSSKPFSIHVDSRLENQNLPEVGLDASKRTAEGPVSVSPSHATPEVPFVDKSTFDVESEKGHTNVPENSTSEEKASSFSGKITTEVAEPRRSNRKIQPTSRLLEGLQSSSIVAKIPTVPHDKGSKVSPRTVSSSSRGHARS